MSQDHDWPDYPRFMIAAARNVSTIRSPADGQEGLAVIAFFNLSGNSAVANPHLSLPSSVESEA